ncbi:acyl carrier protein [Nocardia zapadnayensis]|uniref:acyl carrier protein n=1 Tax=Nocardia rhamnosiphila TaxID=426716 RepID=UPI00224762DA|nr:acyl carrier protein [Nocardia zapadnayensis]MCX0274001.1 acyl carrier protein [Nocardia zapadnayensis]
MNDIEQPIIEYISAMVAETGESAVDRDTLLLESGILDSIKLVRLVQFLEKTFEISIPETEIQAELFESPAQIAAYVSQRAAQPA